MGNDIVQRLRAPAYWFSGSSEVHEGENSAPYEAAKTIESLRAELAKVNMEVDRLTRTNQAKREHRDKLLEAKARDAARIERLEKALRFYADSENYKPRAEAFGDGMYAPHVILDAGYNARAALEDRT